MAKSNVTELLKKQSKKQEVEGVAVEVEGEVPAKAARVADLVILTWGDPNLVGGQTIEIPMIVTLSDPASGRINGQMICDPTMQGMDPRSGRPVQMPSVVPVANVPYSETPRPLTWRFREE